MKTAPAFPFSDAHLLQLGIVFHRLEAIQQALKEFVGLTHHGAQGLDRAHLVLESRIDLALDAPKNLIQRGRKVVCGHGALQPAAEFFVGAPERLNLQLHAVDPRLEGPHSLGVIRQAVEQPQPP